MAAILRGPIHVLTNFQRADGFTKGLDRKNFLEWVVALYDESVHTIYKGVTNSLYARSV